MMHNLRLAALTLGLGLSASPAIAADLAPAPIEPAAPIALPFSWTGFYLGANAGYGAGDGDASIVTPSGPFVPFAINGLKPDGFLVGGQIGYNYQWQHLVIGAEGDIDYFHAHDSQHFDVPVFPFGTETLKAQYDWFGTGRLRLGYAMDRFLMYATGGVAFAKVKGTETFDGSPFLPGNSISDSSTEVGWAAGAGVEYAFTDNWTVKAEFLYADFGSQKFSVDRNFPPPGAEAKIENQLTLGRVGVNYKF